jgi:integrase
MEIHATKDRMRAGSTTNHYLVCLGEALRIAHANKDAAGRPLLPELVKVPKLEEPEHLPRPVSDDDIQAIISTAPPHLSDGVLLARLMGFRKGEVFAFTISQVDFQNRCVWLSAATTKANRAEAVPANDEAMALLRRLFDQAKEWKKDHLLTYQHGKKGERRPVKNAQACLVYRAQKAWDQAPLPQHQGELCNGRGPCGARCGHPAACALPEL